VFDSAASSSEIIDLIQSPKHTKYKDIGPDDTHSDSSEIEM